MNARHDVPGADVQAVARAPTSSSGSSESFDQWRGRRLALARGVWLTLAAALLIGFIASIPVAYQQLRTVCAASDPSQCINGQLTTGSVAALASLGIPVDVYYNGEIALIVGLSLVYMVMGALIFGRRSHTWSGLFFSFFLVLFGSGSSIADGVSTIPVTGLTPTPVHLLILWNAVISQAQWAGVVAAILTFPTGRFTPRWTWAIFALFVPVDILVAYPQIFAKGLPASVSYSTAAAVANVVLIGFLTTAVVAQVYRYMRIYDAAQRQQTKWFVYAFGVSFALLPVVEGLGAVVPALSVSGSWYLLVNGLVSFVWEASFPLAVGVAILRYHLWDIDVLINRTLVYGSLTALLAGLYIGLVAGVQALAELVIGKLPQQPLILVGSTLVVAALAQPLRWRLQTFIDWRFYRKKYDAIRTVARFSATLRDELDTEQIRDELLAVVSETMQPTRLSLWLRSSVLTTVPSPTGREE